jgi:hypothetical protein
MCTDNFEKDSLGPLLVNSDELLQVMKDVVSMDGNAAVSLERDHANGTHAAHAADVAAWRAPVPPTIHESANNIPGVHDTRLPAVHQPRPPNTLYATNNSVSASQLGLAPSMAAPSVGATEGNALETARQIHSFMNYVEQKLLPKHPARPSSTMRTPNPNHNIPAFYQQPKQMVMTQSIPMGTVCFWPHDALHPIAHNSPK